MAFRLAYLMLAHVLNWVALLARTSSCAPLGAGFQAVRASYESSRERVVEATADALPAGVTPTEAARLFRLHP
jgi:hypothetical protein